MVECPLGDLVAGGWKAELGFDHRKPRDGSHTVRPWSWSRSPLRPSDSGMNIIPNPPHRDGQQCKMKRVWEEGQRGGVRVSVRARTRRL